MPTTWLNWRGDISPLKKSATDKLLDCFGLMAVPLISSFFYKGRASESNEYMERQNATHNKSKRADKQNDWSVLPLRSEN